MLPRLLVCAGKGWFGLNFLMPISRKPTDRLGGGGFIDCGGLRGVSCDLESARGGIAGVLFVGLVAGHFGVQIDRGRANARAPLGPAVTHARVNSLRRVESESSHRGRWIF